MGDSYGNAYGAGSWADISDLRDGVQALGGIVGDGTVVQTASWDGEPGMQVTGAYASGDFLAILEVPLTLGAGVISEGQSNGIVLERDFWETAFGGRRDILGTDFRLGDTAYPIIGVAGVGFSGLEPGIRHRFWLLSAPRTFDAPTKQRAQRFLRMVGRLRTPSEFPTLSTQLSRVSTQLAVAFPDTNEGRRFIGVPFQSVRFSPEADQTARAFSFFVMGGAFLLLFLVCANLSGFVLARAEAGRTDRITRLTLGATRWSILRHAWIEAAVLAVPGMVAGVALAAIGVNWLLVRLSGILPIDLSIDLGPRLLIFTLVLGISSSVAFGVLPLVGILRRQEISFLGKHLRAAGGLTPRSRWLHTAVALQVWVAVLLSLVAAGLAQSLVSRTQTDLGFRNRGVSIAKVALPADSGSEATSQRFGEIVSLLQRRGGRVGQTSWLPLTLGTPTLTVSLPHIPPPEGANGYPVSFASVDDAYFEVMDIPLVAGRLFGGSGSPGDKVLQVVVTEAFLRRFGEGHHQVGQLLTLPGVKETGAPAEIVGVVADHMVRDPSETPLPMLYLNMAQMPVSDRYLVGITSRLGGLSSLQGQIAGFADAKVQEAFTIERHLKNALFLPWLLVALFSAMSVVALFLMVLGVAGVAQHSLWRRTEELAVRYALGADLLRLARTIIAEPLAPVGRGLFLGLASAGLAYWTFQRYFVGGTPWNPLIAVVLLAFPICATGAAAWPTWKRLQGDLYSRLR